MSEFINPLPEMTAVSKPFYKAAKERKLMIQRCKDCKHSIFYPKSVCPHCLSDDISHQKPRTAKNRKAFRQTTTPIEHLSRVSQ